MRTDIHSPGQFDPGQYDFVGCMDRGRAEDPGYCDLEVAAAYEIAGEDGAWLGSTGPFPRWDLVDRAALEGARAYDGHFLKRQGCDHCGQHNVRNFSVYIHRETRELVAVGWQCADRFNAASRQELAARQRVKRERERRERELRLERWLHPELHLPDAMRREAARLRRAAEDALEYRDGESWRQRAANLEREAGDVPALGERRRAAYAYLVEHEESGRADGFLTDVLEKARKYGELSDRQVAAVLKSKERAAEWAARREEARASEPDPAPVVEGKAVEVEGRVLTTKYKDTQFGEVLKMLVLDDRGFKVWGTVPSSLELIDCAAGGRVAGPGDDVDHQRALGRGDRVAFVATVEASGDDETFGFYKRPRKARLTEVAS